MVTTKCSPKSGTRTKVARTAFLFDTMTFTFLLTIQLEMNQSVAPVLAGLVCVCRAQFADKNANYVDEEDHVDHQTDQAGRVEHPLVSFDGRNPAIEVVIKSANHGVNGRRD